MTRCKSGTHLTPDPNNGYVPSGDGTPQGLCGVQALQRAVGQGFGVVDQVFGGARHVAFMAEQRLRGAGRGGGGSAQQVADLGQGVFEAEVVMRDEGRQ